MEESDLLKYIEGRLVCIESRVSVCEDAFKKVDDAIDKITDILEVYSEFKNKAECNFYDLDNRCESIESAMEKTLDIIRTHDVLHEKYKHQDIPAWLELKNKTQFQ